MWFYMYWKVKLRADCGSRLGPKPFEAYHKVKKACLWPEEEGTSEKVTFSSQTFPLEHEKVKLKSARQFWYHHQHAWIWQSVCEGNHQPLCGHTNTLVIMYEYEHNQIYIYTLYKLYKYVCIYIYTMTVCKYVYISLSTAARSPCPRN